MSFDQVYLCYALIVIYQPSFQEVTIHLTLTSIGCEAAETKICYAGVDDADDKDTSFIGVHDDDTSLAGVPLPFQQMQITTWTQSLITSHLTGMRLMTIQAKHPYTALGTTYAPLYEEANLFKDQTELDNIEFLKLETQVPILCQSKRISVPPSDYIPWMGGKTYVMNVQTETNLDVEKV